MIELTEQDLAALDPAGCLQDKLDAALYDMKRLRARVAELEADLDSAEEYICELKAEQEGK